MLKKPINFILSPQILRSIAINGNSEQRENALNTLSFDSTFRQSRRDSISKKRSPASFSQFLIAEEQRFIFDAKHKQKISGTLVRSEDSTPSSDPSANEAYDGLGITFEFYRDIFERNSIDDAGMKLLGLVHFSKDYDNAFWNGEYMVFGDGDGDLFNRFTACIDIIGHELTHGVTQFESSLHYSGQSGALNESLSDAFGSMIKQYHRKQKAEDADWLIGEGLLTKNVQGVALRSLKKPGSAYDDPVLGRDQQPSHVKNYLDTYQDNGGVHINSGIPNYCFYLIATRLGGASWLKAGRIWYETLKDVHLKPSTGFKDFAKLTILCSQRLFGRDSEEFKVVIASWKDVGISF